MTETSTQFPKHYHVNRIAKICSGVERQRLVHFFALMKLFQTGQRTQTGVVHRRGPGRFLGKSNPAFGRRPGGRGVFCTVQSCLALQQAVMRVSHWSGKYIYV